MGEHRLYLIDATAFCYRAFYALGNLSTSYGQPTNAVYGFLVMLNKILKEKQPQLLAACFDISRDTFRQKKFSGYKMNRPPMPDGLTSQIPVIKEIIAAYGIALFEKEGYEADDIIATIAKRAAQEGIATTVVSSDKDMLQLVNKTTRVLNPYKDEGLLYDEAAVVERFGVSPEHISDIIALMGDDVDNIPGIPGVGEKTAVRLIRQFGSVDELLRNLDTIAQEKLQQTIREHTERIRLNRELAVLEDDVSFDIDWGALKVSSPDYEKLYGIFKRMEFKKLILDLPFEHSHEQQKDIAVASDEEFNGMREGHPQVSLFVDTEGKLFLAMEGKAMRVESIGKNCKSMLQDQRISKVGHDLKAVKVSLAKNGVGVRGLSFDTMVAGYLLNPAKSRYSLNDLSWDFLGKPVQEGPLAAGQALLLIEQLQPKLKQELEDKTLLALFSDLEMPMVEVLAEMEFVGIKLEPKVLKKLAGDLEKRLIALIEKIYELSGCQFNINSPKQLREILFEKLKLPVVKRTKTGPSTDEEVLRALASQHSLAALLLEYRQITKLKTTYVDALPLLMDPATCTIHTSFNQTATETGRLSSSNPNLQNIPIKTELGRTIRESVVAFDDKSYLLSCDYSQIELRILAHMSKDENLMAAFKEDKDIHRATASLIYAVEEKEVTGEMRDTAKRVNFGIIYGLTPFGLARDLAISLGDAQNFIDAYFLRYPRVKEYVQDQITKARNSGFVTTILGRRRYIPEINSKNQSIRQVAERQAINTPIQGSASDLIKLAMVRIHRDRAARQYKSSMILQIHDELLFNVNRDEAGVFEGFVKEAMETVLSLDVSIRVDMKRGKNWSEMEDTPLAIPNA